MGRVAAARRPGFPSGDTNRPQDVDAVADAVGATGVDVVAVTAKALVAAEGVAEGVTALNVSFVSGSARDGG
jgi:hypothetical protein